MRHSQLVRRENLAFTITGDANIQLAVRAVQHQESALGAGDRQCGVDRGGKHIVNGAG
ncbi:hypothetical protein D3C83_214870 [compost metagenome]